MNILSIKVADLLSILVGLDITGKHELDDINSIKLNVKCVVVVDIEQIYIKISENNYFTML